jgi:hypothetical protein
MHFAREYMAGKLKLLDVERKFGLANNRAIGSLPWFKYPDGNALDRLVSTGRFFLRRSG